LIARQQAESGGAKRLDGWCPPNPDRYEFSRMDYVCEVTLARAIQRARVRRFPLQIFASRRPAEKKLSKN
jgi:hypothetical protein